MTPVKVHSEDFCSLPFTICELSNLIIPENILGCFRVVCERVYTGIRTAAAPCAGCLQDICYVARM